MRTLIPLIIVLSLSLVTTAAECKNLSVSSFIGDSTNEKIEPKKRVNSLSRGNTTIQIYVVRNTRVSWFEDKNIEISINDEHIGSSKHYSAVKIGRWRYDLVTFHTDLKPTTQKIEAVFNIRLRGYDWKGEVQWPEVRGPKPGESLTLKAFAKIHRQLFNSKVYLDIKDPSYEKTGISHRN